MYFNNMFRGGGYRPPMGGISPNMGGTPTGGGMMQARIPTAPVSAVPLSGLPSAPPDRGISPYGPPPTSGISPFGLPGKQSANPMVAAAPPDKQAFGGQQISPSMPWGGMGYGMMRPWSPWSSMMFGGQMGGQMGGGMFGGGLFGGLPPGLGNMLMQRFGFGGTSPYGMPYGSPPVSAVPPSGLPSGAPPVSATPSSGLSPGAPPVSAAPPSSMPAGSPPVSAVPPSALSQRRFIGR